jgi:hypothetical protein
MKRAGEQLSIDFKTATAFDHSTARGEYREEGVRQFLSSQKPDRYAIDTGFAYDARDETSGQLDIMIYRRYDTPPLLTGKSLVVPCESLLAAVEVKSKLTAGEIRDSLKIARSIRQLSPFGKQFIDAPGRGAAAPASDMPRCQFSIFAFSTDLEPGDDWLNREGSRLRRYAKELDIPVQWVDRLIVLDRGIINCIEGRGHDSVRSGQSALQIWFVHLLNYLRREDARRKGIDIDIYGGQDQWMSLPDWGIPRGRKSQEIKFPAQREAQGDDASRRGKQTERTRRRTRQGRTQ